jgi:hypothetical protein
MLHPDDRETVMAESGALNASGDAFDPRSIERHHQGRPGHIVVHDHARRRRSAGENSWQGVLIDITERKMTEEALSRTRHAILQAAGFAAGVPERTVVDGLHRREPLERAGKPPPRAGPHARLPERSGADGGRDPE